MAGVVAGVGLSSPVSIRVDVAAGATTCSSSILMTSTSESSSMIDMC